MLVETRLTKNVRDDPLHDFSRAEAFFTCVRAGRDVESHNCVIALYDCIVTISLKSGYKRLKSLLNRHDLPRDVLVLPCERAADSAADYTI
jgi:hypothetical protein